MPYKKIIPPDIETLRAALIQDHLSLVAELVHTGQVGLVDWFGPFGWAIEWVMRWKGWSISAIGMAGASDIEEKDHRR